MISNNFTSTMMTRIKKVHVYLWLIHVDGWQKSTQYYNYPSIKSNKLREKSPITTSVGEETRILSHC